MLESPRIFHLQFKWFCENQSHQMTWKAPLVLSKNRPAVQWRLTSNPNSGSKVVGKRNSGHHLHHTCSEGVPVGPESAVVGGWGFRGDRKYNMKPTKGCKCFKKYNSPELYNLYIYIYIENDSNLGNRDGLLRLTNFWDSSILNFDSSGPGCVQFFAVHGNSAPAYLLSNSVKFTCTKRKRCDA